LKLLESLPQTGERKIKKARGKMAKEAILTPGIIKWIVKRFWELNPDKKRAKRGKA
jgi:hypothetical protein